MVHRRLLAFEAIPLLFLFLAGWLVTPVAYSAASLEGYWYLPGSPSSNGICEARALVAVSAGGKFVVVNRPAFPITESDILTMQLSAKGNRIELTSADIPYDSEYEIHWLDDNRVQFVSSKEAFVYHRIPEGWDIHKAVLRLAMTGRVSTITVSGLEQCEGEAHAMHIEFRAGSRADQP